ncbi:MAG TPA: ribokinase [Opitutaceae bacterium]|nr:ribokinase [Opitutaceae bacterium]
MKPQVIVVGSFVQDLTFRVPTFPRPGETLLGEFVSGPGGKGSNQAVACGRLGVPTLFIGAVGPDNFAESAKRFYAAEKIGAKLISKPRQSTGTAGILVDAQGQNQIIVALGANAHLKKNDISEAQLRGAKVVACQFESDLGATLHTLRLARKVGAIAVLNPAPMRSDFSPEILRHVDVLIPNESEFVTMVNAIAGLSSERFNEDLLHRMPHEMLHQLVRKLGVKTVIITLGSKGCFVSTEEKHLLLPAHAGIQVVDTTGAGDAFVGGFCAGLVTLKNNIVEAAAFASAVAALSVTKPGTAPAMPRKAEVSRFLRSALHRKASEVGRTEPKATLDTVPGEPRSS